MLSRRGFLKSLLGVTLAGFGISAYGSVVEAGLRLRVQRWAISPAGWPRGQRLRIVMIADIHAGAPHMTETRMAAIVARSMAEAGDLVVLMGDYRASHRFQTRIIPVEEVAPILATLTAPLGVHAILGNHDWWDDQAAQDRRGPGPIHTGQVLQSAGIEVLSNQALKLGQGDGAFWLAGLDSQVAFRNRLPGQPRGVDDLPGTLAQIADHAPVILLAHEPDIFAEMPDRVCLTLSGHTHGGQIRLFGWAPAVPSRYGQRFAYGHITEGARDLVVSGGLGCSIFPMRLGMPPEITVVDLS